MNFLELVVKSNDRLCNLYFNVLAQTYTNDINMVTNIRILQHLAQVCEHRHRHLSFSLTLYP